MLYLFIAVVLFILFDFLIRQLLKKTQENKLRKEREKALHVGLNLDFTREAKSLKRIEVENPKAKILCVDDEEVILDSFRKILVIDGYSVDTVESGKEALGLIQIHHYDFVFTDLKMPEMDGVEVTKSVKHLRPDIDVIIITGYAAVETAVETMKFGAMDYVQKPFTEDELLEFTKKSLIKRKDRIQKELKPKVQVKQISDIKMEKEEEFLIPGGVFISKSHCWIGLNTDGSAKIGIDDFAGKIIGRIDDIEFPNPGRTIQINQPLFSVKQGNRNIPFYSPISGKIVKVNSALKKNLEELAINTYQNNWICEIEADNIDAEIKDLKIGQSAVSFFQEEIENCKTHFKQLYEMRKGEKELASKNGKIKGVIEKLDQKNFENMIDKFFKRS